MGLLPTVILLGNANSQDRRVPPGLPVSFLAALFAFPSQVAVGQCGFFETHKLTASDGHAQFGWDVAVWGDLLVVGAPGQNVMGLTGAGASYLFGFDGRDWAEEQEFVASDAEASDRFGSSVSVYGASAIVGAPLNDDDGVSSGSAYAFRFDGSNGSKSRSYSRRIPAPVTSSGRPLR